MANFGIGRWVSFALLAMVVVAVWKVNNGDLGKIVEAAWSLINWGADQLTLVWEKFVASGQAQSAVDQVTK